MFVIVETGGNQYKISKDSVIDVEKLDGQEGDKIKLNKVLFVQNEDGSCLVGQPLLNNINVEAQILSQYKDDKVISFKKRKRKNSRRKRGHRQNRTELKILNIKISSK
jgi:large subunit ribosomal protein L21